ncbi:hypothetical protein EW145_g2742 [Phellinidium pouzarii]|uniref:DASH complex subunit DUO1 n=1 Tax=Phellinidium pouzarii TaxID=167371 RepID=A0A4S4LF61_9AGAM|nr:hypothetical protein EW145_g2742 [Phellinidium pouzarii]
MDDSYESSVPLRSRFYSASPIGDTTYDGQENADLSLSELSLNGKAEAGAGPSQPFSLLARPSQPSEPDITIQEDRNEDDVIEKEVEIVDDEEARTRSVARTRDERLRHDLFVLRKLNSGLAVYTDALSDTRSSTERVTGQLTQTNALLDKYIDILAKSESATRLIFDERWHGAEDDEAVIERLEQEAEEKARREAEERALAKQKEQERVEKEVREQHERAEKERIEAEKKEKLAIRAGYGRVRGVRGTRASTRAKGAPSSRTGDGISQRPRANGLGFLYSKFGRTFSEASIINVCTVV